MGDDDPRVRWHWLHGVSAEVDAGIARCLIDTDAALMFDVSVIHRRQNWEWQVRNDEGVIVMQGRERSRPAARYRGYRALFLLLEATFQFAKKASDRRKRSTK